MHTTQHRTIQIFIQAVTFVFLILICPAAYAAPSPAELSELSSDELQKETLIPPIPLPDASGEGAVGRVNEGLQDEPDERFKNAVRLINAGSYEEAEKILQALSAVDLWREKAYFVLGRLYKEQGFFNKAEDCLKLASEKNFLLKDYALKLLVDIYTAEKEFDKAAEAAREIQNKTLLQEARQSEIASLLKLNNEKAAVKVLSRYINEYPDDREYKLLLARLLKESEKAKAISLLKEIYIDANPFSADALQELKDMDAARFTKGEVLSRAENLQKAGSFGSAESAFKSILKSAKGSAFKDKIRFSIGTCQFRQKKYNEAAESFKAVKTPEAMYWRARSALRINTEGFEDVIKRFKKEYPGNRYLAELLILSGDEKRRDGKFGEAETVLREVLKKFPGKSEEALWGLGWMYYTKGDYKEALKYFSKLTTYTGSEEYLKYVYWEMKSREIASEECAGQKAEHVTEDIVCPEESQVNPDYYKSMEKRSYYGFLVRMHLKGQETYDRSEVTIPEIPHGDVYRRIDMLKFIGMKKEAIQEIKAALKFADATEEFEYLAFAASEMDEYRSIIHFADKNGGRKFLPFAYPLGYWGIVSEAAGREAVDAYLVEALIREESRFDPEAVSGAGALGLMQLMPFTAHRMKTGLDVRITDNSDIHEVGNNIFIGTHYLSLLIKEFGEIPLAVASYNAGENALKKWLMNSRHKSIEEFIEDIPYRETRRYVKNVLRSYWQYRTMNSLPIQGFSYRISASGQKHTDN